MQIAQSAPVYATLDAKRLEAVVHLGAPSPAMAVALDLAGIATSQVEHANDVDSIVEALGKPTLMIPVERWVEMRARRPTTRTVLVAHEGNDMATLAALDDGADDVVLPTDDTPILRAILSREPLGGYVGESSAMHAPRLAELSAEMAKMARKLDDLAQADIAPDAERDALRLNLTAPQVRGLIRARRARGQYFAVDLFADPAWDILLDLMASRLEGRQVSVSSLCIAAAVPPTTALRWIKSMTDAALLQRQPDPVDGRRVFIDLSPKAVDAMNAYMANAPRGMVAV